MKEEKCVCGDPKKDHSFFWAFLGDLGTCNVCICSEYRTKKEKVTLTKEDKKKWRAGLKALQENLDND